MGYELCYFAWLGWCGPLTWGRSPLINDFPKTLQSLGKGLEHKNITQWVKKVTILNRRLSDQWLDPEECLRTCNHSDGMPILQCSQRYSFKNILSYCLALLYMVSYKEDICPQLSFERGPRGQFHLKGWSQAVNLLVTLFTWTVS